MNIFVKICWLFGLVLAFLISDIFKQPDSLQDSNGNFLLLFVFPLLVITIFTLIAFIVHLIKNKKYPLQHFYIAAITFFYCVIQTIFSFWHYTRNREKIILEKYMDKWSNTEELLDVLHQQSIFQLQTHNTHLFFSTEIYVGLFAFIYICFHLRNKMNNK